jgi:hypothetical protein
MNWFKENKFLAGLLIVLVLGVGAFGFLILSARGKLAEATEAYESLANERTRLHNLKPYPSPENLKELTAQKEQATAKINELHKALAAAELPVEAMTPVQFQDKLRAAVTEVTTLAGTTTKLPEKFFLGFERYETATPDVAAAPLLGRQLKAIQWLVTRLIENKVAEIGEFNREPLPEEGGKEAAPATPPPAAQGRGGKAAKEEKVGPPLVQPRVLDLTATGDQAALRALLNDIVGSKAQFFIPRLVSFKNEKDVPPKKAEAAAPAAAADPNADPNAAAPAAAATPAAPPTTYIVGLEKVAMTLKLEMVDFVDPTAAPAPK